MPLCQQSLPFLFLSIRKELYSPFHATVNKLLVADGHISIAYQDKRNVQSVWPKQLGHEYLGGIEHLADASAWKARGGA